MRYDEIIEQIKATYDIVEVIGRYVPLKRAGSNYKGICPFHSEKTPSFVVSPEKQIFTCFGCGATGNVIKFVQMYESLDFPQALEKLADEAGIEIKKTSNKYEQKKEEMYEVSRMAARHYYKNLRQGSNEGLKYVVKRGISPETAKKFGIGFAKSDWQDTLDYFNENSISSEIGLEIGIFSKNRKDEGLYDKFRNRVIFPIINTRDKVIGFGGRAIDDSTPKYLNSPESIIFKKKENLYGLNLAKTAIRKENLAIMVEGYMDVVSLADAGIENVVATLGTAMTPEQAKLLKRYADTVVLSYDSDGAGQAAAMRGIDILKSVGCHVKILMLDEGKDPDEYIKKNGKEAFKELVNKAISYMEFKINGIKNKYDMNTTDGSIRFLEEISREIRKIKSPVEQASFIKLVSEMTRIPESSIWREIEAGGDAPRDIIAPTKESETSNNPDSPKYERSINRVKSPVVKTIIKLMIDNGKFIPLVAENDEIANYFYGSGYEEIMEQIVMRYTSDSEVDLDELRDSLAEPERELLEDIINNFLPISNEEGTFLQCVKRIKLYDLRKRHKEILKILDILDEEENKEEITKLSEELMYLGNLIRELKA